MRKTNWSVLFALYQKRKLKVSCLALANMFYPSWVKILNTLVVLIELGFSSPTA